MATENSCGCSPSSASAPPRRALAFVQRNSLGSEPATSPWQERAKALQQGVAAASNGMSPVDAERTRANIVKAREAIERWARVTATDDVATTDSSLQSPSSPYNLRGSPEVRVSEFFGFAPRYAVNSFTFQLGGNCIAASQALCFWSVWQGAAAATARTQPVSWADGAAVAPADSSGPGGICAAAASV